MSFSRYKALLRLAQISSRNVEYNHEIGLRFYSKKIIFSSASPHEAIIKPKSSTQTEDELEADLLESIDDSVDTSEYEQQPRRKEQKIKWNYTVRDNPKYRTELSNVEEVHEVIKLKHNPSISDDTRILTSLPEGEENNKFKNEPLHVEDVNSVNTLEPISSSTDIENINTLPLVKNKNSNSDSTDEIKVFSRYKILETPEGYVKVDLSADEFNIDQFMKQFNDNVAEPLDECKEDLSDFGPSFSPTFNFAAYADKSKLIQEFVKLGVKLFKVERNQDHMRALLTVDLEKELPMYIQFLHDCGVPADSLGDVITDNPMILKEDMDDMKTRIRYLRAHDFTVESIARIVTKNPTWLTWATKYIDERLGHFQNEFNLIGSEVRYLATKQPKLITFNFKHIHQNTFAIREQMGFSRTEIKVLLLSKPRLWMNARKKIVDSFDYLHNTMKLSHLTIASHSDVLTCRKSRIKNRHEFLVELKKDQYDPKKPGYIAPTTLVVGSDAEFCRDIAKTAVETYNLFLKTR